MKKLFFLSICLMSLAGCCGKKCIQCPTQCQEETCDSSQQQNKPAKEIGWSDTDN